MFIFFHGKRKRTKRNRPCPASPCASSLRPARAELTRLSTGSNSPRAFIRPHRRCSARDKGDEPQNSKGVLKPPSGDYLRLPALRVKPHSICTCSAWRPIFFRSRTSSSRSSWESAAATCSRFAACFTKADCMTTRPISVRWTWKKRPSAVS